MRNLIFNFGWYSDHPKEKNGYDFAFNFLPNLAVAKDSHDDGTWQITFSLSWLFFVLFMAISSEED